MVFPPKDDEDGLTDFTFLEQNLSKLFDENVSTQSLADKLKEMLKQTMERNTLKNSLFRPDLTTGFSRSKSFWNQHKCTKGVKKIGSPPTEEHDIDSFFMP